MKKTLLLFGLISFMINFLSAQSHTWVGGMTGNWSVAANWNPGVPGAGAHVKIDGGSIVTVDVNASVASILQLGVGGTAGHLVVAAGITLNTTNRGIILGDAGSSFTIDGTYETTNVDNFYDAIRNNSGGTVTISATGTFIANNVQNGHGLTTNGTVDNYGVINLQSISGQPGINSSIGGATTNKSTGVISIEGPINNLFALRGTITNEGTIKGNSTMGPDAATILSDVALDGGTLSPGLSIGLLSFRSGFAPSAVVVFDAEIDKTGASLTSDVLNCFNGGGASFNFSNVDLVVTEIGGTSLIVGDIFTVVTTPFGFTGTFNSTDFSTTTIPMGASWTVNYGAANITIEVTAPAPVSLLRFNAINEAKAINLLWETATEKNNQGFELLRSNDGRNWKKISWIEGNGSTQIAQRYNFSDNNPLNGNSFYQLKQVDYDGRYEMSEVLMVEWNHSPVISVFPNPAKTEVSVVFSKGEKAQKVSLIDQSGRVVKSLDWNNGTLNLIGILPGAYSLSIQVGNKTYSELLIVE